MSFTIVVATHGRFGEALVESAQMIVGEMADVHTLSLLSDKSFETFMVEARDLLDSLSGPIVVLVDLFGGTPSNVLTVLTRQYTHHVFTGVNLPVLIALYLFSQNAGTEPIDLEAVRRELTDTFHESLVYTNERLEQ